MTFIKSIVVGLALANIGYFLWLHGVAQSQAVPAVTSAGETLRLASEAPALGAAEAAGAQSGGALPAAGSEGAPGAAADARRCVSVGPFKDLAEAAQAASTLRSGGYDPRQRLVDGEATQAHAPGLGPGVADRKRTGNLYWIDIDLKPSDGALNPADFQGEAGHINRLEVKACPAAAAYPPSPAAAS